MSLETHHKPGGVLVAHPKDSMTDLAPYDLQVGGHHKGCQSHVLKDKNGRILKPLKLNANPTFNPNVKITSRENHSEDELLPVCRDELEFYQRIAISTNPDDVSLQHLMPSFYGTQTVQGPDGKAELHLLLGDLTWGLQHPCVADIKIGRTDFYPGKNSKKRGVLHELGFRLTGMRIVQIEAGSSSKDDCKAWTTSQMLEGLDKFCHGTTRVSTYLRHSIVSQLQHIHHWALSQRSYKIRGSSILVVYDAEQLTSVPQDIVSGKSVVAGEVWPKVIVKMIDFAHVLHSFGGRDENYIFGLENLMKYMNNRENEIL